MRNLLSLLCCAVTLVGTTALSACGQENVPQAPSCDTPGVTGQEIAAGLVYPDSGLGADIFTPLRAGVDARFGAANAAGGVHGRQITYETRNDQAQAPVNRAVSQKLVEEGDVFGILQASVASSGSADYLAERGVPVVGLAVEKVWTRYRNMFTFGYSFTGEGSVDTFGQFVREQGGTRALIFYNVLDATVSPQIAQQLATSLAAAGVTSSSIGGDNDPAPDQIEALEQRMRAEGADTIVGAIGAEGLAEIVTALRRNGLPVKVVLSGSQAPSRELLAQYGSSIAGLTTFTSYRPLELNSPAIDAYRTNMARFAPELQDANQTLALVGYIVADIFVRGLQEAGACPTRQSFIDGLRAVKSYDAGGLLNAIDFDADFGKLEECYSFTQVNAAGDRIEVVNPSFCGRRLD